MDDIKDNFHNNNKILTDTERIDYLLKLSEQQLKLAIIWRERFKAWRDFSLKYYDRIIAIRPEDRIQILEDFLNDYFDTMKTESLAGTS